MNESHLPDRSVEWDGWAEGTGRWAGIVIEDIELEDYPYQDIARYTLNVEADRCFRSRTLQVGYTDDSLLCTSRAWTQRAELPNVLMVRGGNQEQDASPFGGWGKHTRS